MTTQARIGHGLLFRIRDTRLSPPALVEIGEITNLNGPSIAADAVEATNTRSTVSGSPPSDPDGWREFIPGLADAGEVSGDLNFVPGSAGQDVILWAVRKKVYGEIEIPGDSPPYVWQLSGLILTAFGLTGPVDDKMSASFTFKISAQPVLTNS